MKLRRPLVPASLAALALLGAGCGSIDQNKVQTGIKTGIEKQTKVKVRSVSCPEDRPIKKGDRFECKVTATDGSTGTVDVVQTNDKGDVRWNLKRGS
jgi:hypothetical protein